MTININGVDKRIGLALSGGGYRATAFHLGVFRKLQQKGLLWKLDLLSCVSGGSIAGAYLATNWGDDSALDRLDRYLSTQSIAVSSVVGGLLSPFESRLDKLMERYAEDLFGAKTLDDLKAGPRIYLNATNLSTGNMFFFVAGENKDSEMGEHELGVKPAPEFTVARAVAASSAFPPVFPPMKIDRSEYDVEGVDYVTLTDGGVYDNLGVNPTFRSRNALDYVLVSDAGKPFENDATPTESSAVVLKESLTILMEQVRGLEFKRLQLTSAQPDEFNAIWFSIDSREGEAQSGDASFASSIKTNLSRLSQPERDVLSRHAGALLEHRLQTYAPELLV